MIHHESIEARMASEQTGAGRFDVIEQDDGDFQVCEGDGGFTYHYATLEEAKAAAQRIADDFDNRKVAGLKRSWKADPHWDIETTEGFEWCQQELYIFRLETELSSAQNELHGLRTGLAAFARLISGFLPTQVG